MVEVILNGNQKKALAETINIALKQHGMKYFQNVSTLLAVLDNPTHTTEDNISSYAFSNEHAPILEEVFDIALKQVGLSGFYGVSELVNIFMKSFQQAQEQLHQQEYEIIDEMPPMA